MERELVGRFDGAIYIIKSRPSWLTEVGCTTSSVLAQSNGWCLCMVVGYGGCAVTSPPTVGAASLGRGRRHGLIS